MLSFLSFFYINCFLSYILKIEIKNISYRVGFEDQSRSIIKIASTPHYRENTGRRWKTIFDVSRQLSLQIIAYKELPILFSEITSCVS